MAEQNLDVVGYWTEVKLSILRDYFPAYAAIMSKQPSIRHFAFIDGFAGAGTHISRTSGQEIDGSPSIAMNTEPPFSHYHFIEMDGQRAERLHQLASGRSDVTVHQGDCNSVLLQDVFPKCRYGDFRRAICLLDPYGLNPHWEVVRTAGQMKSIEIFLNFMIMDANMNVLWRNPDKVAASQIERMTAFWGDDSWRKAGYTSDPGLFGDIEEKATNAAIISAYRDRLKKVAGFKFVPEPLPMRNSIGKVIYYLFFASHNATGDKVIRAIFSKYQNRGLSNGS